MGTTDKKFYEVEIAGVPLKLKTAHDQETVDELVSYVNKKINEALPVTRTRSLQTAALLSCLNIAEEMILLKRRARQRIQKVEKKAERIMSNLESSRIPRLRLDN